MCLTLPETLITVMGIEKVLPRWDDLGVFLQLLPRSSTGERMNPYTSLWTGVRAGDGPRAFHLVLLDAGRTRVLADPEGRPALRCIRCSACLNICPVYRQTGGHAYHTVYAGPDRRDPAAAALGRDRPAGDAPVRVLALRRLLRGLPGEDRHPADPRPRAREGRARRGAGAPGRLAAALARVFSDRRALRARAAARPGAAAAGACATVASAGSPGRSRLGQSRELPRCRRRRSASGGGNVSAARDEVLARIRAARDHVAPSQSRAARVADRPLRARSSSRASPSASPTTARASR